MLGHEMLSSIAWTPSASDRMRDTSAYSSTLVPQTFTMTVDVSRPQLRQLLFDEPSHPDALQADRVHHPGRSLDDSRRRMSFALLEEQAFDGHAPERREVHEIGVLDAVAEASACGNERILQSQRTDLNGQVHVISPSVFDRRAERDRPDTIARDETSRRRRASARRSCSSRPSRSP